MFSLSLASLYHVINWNGRSAFQQVVVVRPQAVSRYPDQLWTGTSTTVPDMMGLFDEVRADVERGGVFGVLTWSSGSDRSYVYDAYVASRSGRNFIRVGFDHDIDKATDLIRAELAARVDQAAVEAQAANLLEKTDWYTHMSDDAAVWAGGERKMDLLMQALSRLPEDKARELWATHETADVAFPEQIV